MDENRWAGLIEARLINADCVVTPQTKNIIEAALKEAFAAQDGLWNGVCGKALLSERRVTLRDAARAVCPLCRESAGAGPGEPATKTENPPPKVSAAGPLRWHHGDKNGGQCLASEIWNLFEETPL